MADYERDQAGSENEKMMTSEAPQINKQQDNMKKQKSDRTEQQNRPHFAIDWRQLTYFQKEQSSFFGLNRKQQQQYSVVDDTTTAKCESPDNNQPTLCTSPTPSCSRDSKSNKKRILNELDGCFKSGQLSAILGPSGAGKTTFLSSLFGDKQESAYGRTKVTWFRDSKHQQPIEQAHQIPKRPIRIAFLPQHDHLLHHLTVYETLMFASKIKNYHAEKVAAPSGSDSHSTSRRRRSFHQQNVRRVAKMLKLIDCFDTRCGKLSGGQYKRVSIGQELLSEPDVIILDEPTSGLDAMTCLTTIKTLKSIVTKHPMSIVLTIHQPDIDVFNLFDHIYVIAQGGLAIYEGPPRDVVPTLARAGLFMPSATYNPARFIVENAFIIGPEGVQSYDQDGQEDGEELGDETSDESSFALSEDEDEQDRRFDDERQRSRNGAGLIRRSVLSLTEAITGSAAAEAGKIDLSLMGGGGKLRDSGRRPLLNIGVQCSDGRLITSKQFSSDGPTDGHAHKRGQLKPDRDAIRRAERYNLLRRLNEIQRAKYGGRQATTMSEEEDDREDSSSGTDSGTLERPQQKSQMQTTDQEDGNVSSSSSTKSDYSSEVRTTNSHTNSIKAASLARVDDLTSELNDDVHGRHDSRSESNVAANKSDEQRKNRSSQSMQTINRTTTADDRQSIHSCSSSRANEELKIVSTAENQRHHHHIMIPSPSSTADHHRHHHHGTKSPSSGISDHSSASSSSSAASDYSSSQTTTTTMRRQKLTRQFDKRLSAKHNCSKQKDYPIWYHAFLLTHRTWLSIVRDPVFFGIQFCMHTTIPILLALIFGSTQEEGCPRIGNFDLVEFAYSSGGPDHQEDFIRTTIRSIRQSIGNIGVVFFEMFVLSFAINCITALVFPLDMYVLLKEYRNGWYTLRSYFFGRTLADLPVPVVLHSMAMTILYFMTGQPLSLARFTAIIGIVILASLVAQSVGLTIGALLMRSSQSAVLAAAGIVAPFFALSGFIVRIHTLPWVAQFFANGSYLYHLLNGFIILRYGFGRCPCESEDFEPNPAHTIPMNLRTMASIWIGTYSDEYLQTGNPMVLEQARLANKTQNIDPNIDLIDKLMSAFKSANSYGHQIETCQDVIPYAMLDFNLHDSDIVWCTMSLVIMLIVSRVITFSAIYYKIRSFS